MALGVYLRGLQQPYQLWYGRPQALGILLGGDRRYVQPLGRLDHQLASLHAAFDVVHGGRKPGLRVDHKHEQLAASISIRRPS
jgi:hypothetical protein